MKCQRALFTK